VGALTSTDVDAGSSFTYTLVSGTGSTDNAAFNISGNNLRLSVSPDFETKSSYSVRLRTTDAGGLSFEKVFTITVNNVNEAPSDIALSASTVNENIAINTVVGALTSTDVDAGSTFTYTLVAGSGDTDNAAFNISGNNLRLSVSPDFETKSSYSVRVRTTDAGGLFFEKSFTIIITDINDAPTDVVLSATAVNENVAVNTVVGALTSTDADAGSTFTYTLVSGTGSTDNAAFNISGNSLRLSVSPDFETKSSYSVRVRTTDAGGLFFEKSFTIAVSDINDAPTDVVLSATAVNENVAINTVVGALSSTDADAASTFTYTLVSGTGSTDNAAFNISGNNLRLSVSPDFETKSSYSIRVRTTDQDGLSFEKVLIINVTNVNEAPSNIVLSNTNLFEGNVIDRVIGNLSSTDQDVADTFSYSLVSGDVLFFGIVGNQLRANISFNNNRASYNLRIRTTDVGGLSFERDFTITISRAPVILGTGSQTGSNTSTAASTTPVISKGFGSQLSVIGSGYTSYSWSPATGLSSTSIANPVAKPLQTTTYTLTVTNAFGNTTTASITVVVNEDYNLIASNILTPNGDGQNDTWVVENLSNYANHEVKIFDRTGRLLYSTRNYQNDWNGELNGAMLAQGTYYYTITFGPNIAPKKGFITLIR
jgi:gliding motility-associated-like protein